MFYLFLFIFVFAFLTSFGKWKKMRYLEKITEIKEEEKKEKAKFNFSEEDKFENPISF